MRNSARRIAPVLMAALLAMGGPALPALAEELPQVSDSQGIAAVAEKARSSVVGILTTLKADRSTEKGRAAGTGFVYKEGYIITNAHVVEDASEVRVLYPDQTVETVPTAQIFADPISDIAVIKVQAGHLAPLPFGDSDAVQVGQQVVAVGNPLGFRLGNSVSAGILSGVGRALGSGYPFLQVDAPINPGNSGGPLFNLQGEVIGINSAKMTDIGVEGLGFAIPIHTAQEIAEVLIRDGKVERATLGISLEEGWEAYFGVPDAEGVTIANVVEDGPAGMTALDMGDKLIRLDEKPIYTSDDVAAFLAAKKPGDEVTVTVKRRGQVLTANVTLGSQEALRQEAEGEQPEEAGGILVGLTTGQIQEAAEFGRNWSIGWADVNQDYYAVSGSDSALLFTEYLYVARRISSAYQLGFTPGVGLQQAAADEIRNKVEVRMLLNGDREGFLDGATFVLEQEGLPPVTGSLQDVAYTKSADGSVVSAKTAVLFPTTGLSRTKDLTVTVKRQDGRSTVFNFRILDLR